MTIVSTVIVHPNPGVKRNEVQKQREGCDLARKHGAENVTVLATMIGGRRPTPSASSPPPRTDAVGEIQQAQMDDPEFRRSCLRLARSPPGEQRHQ